MKINILSRNSKLFGASAAALPVFLAIASVAFATLGMGDLGTLHRATEFLAAKSSPQDERHAQALKSIWVDGGSDGLAAASFERRISDVLLTNRLEQKSMEVVPGTDRAITVSVSMNGNLAGLRRALFMLETGTPFVFVKSMDVRRQDQTPAEAAANTAAPLSIQLVLQSFAKESNS